MAQTSAAERAWCVSVPHHPTGAGLARGRVSAELAGSIPPPMLADAIAVIAELVGNAIRHADALPGDVIRVAWQLRHHETSPVVTVIVTDGGADSEPELRTPRSDSLDGRGLAIVNALAESWGYERDGLGQSVWAELAA